jgi:hypothetical protein
MYIASSYTNRGSYSGGSVAEAPTYVFVFSHKNAMSRKRDSNGRFKTSGGSLTGGTGDVKPQIMVVDIPAPDGVDDYSFNTINVPRVILQGAGSATIMEILKAWFYVGAQDFTDSNSLHWSFLSTAIIRQQSAAASLTSFLSDQSNPLVFGMRASERFFLTSGASGEELPLVQDFTDSNGNGILIATDQIFVTCGGAGNTTASRNGLRLLYRMVSVGITEYVGIVQSQLG